MVFALSQMVAKGRDASSLFAAVVKNVVSANLEVKKLVYVYLVRYAEEQQDLALLSISTFQRALKVRCTCATERYMEACGRLWCAASNRPPPC